MATQPETKPGEYAAPSLFESVPVRSIPVASVSQPAWAPAYEDDEDEAMSARAAGGQRTERSAAHERAMKRASARQAPAEAATRARRTATKRQARASTPLLPLERTTKPKPRNVPEPKKKRRPEVRAEPVSETAAAPVTTEPSEDKRPAAAEPTPSPPVAPENGRKRGLTAEAMAAAQREISVSEFFAKNRHLLGFDNKRKALLTTVKEAVDNALDACEEAGILPELWIAIDQLAEDRFKVTVRDNGPGIVRSQIANIFGKLLYGSKFHRLKMSRGQQGIGISAAGMYGLLTTGKSVHITSRTSPKKPAHHMQIQMDTAKNRADVIVDEEDPEITWPQGTEVVIELVATYAKGRQSVDEYIEQTAIANPHALIHYQSPVPEHREFPRASQELPAETRAIKPHPHGIELGVLMKMLKDARPQKKGQRFQRLASFLQESFCRVSPRTAAEICTAARLSADARAHEIGTHDVEQLYGAMQQVRIMAPPTDCLAPIGVRNLLAGLLKEVKAEFFTATTRDPAVYRGNPFQIEIALAYGGNLSSDQPARVIRFANRVPLLYQQSACAAFKSVLDVDWRNYGISQPSGSLPVGPLVVMIHMASVWVPFTSESKEAVADYDEIRKEMKLALQECGRKAAAYVRRRKRQRLESERRNIFERYIPDVAEALANLTGQQEERLLKELQSISKRRTAIADLELDENGKPATRNNGETAPPGEGAADEFSGDASTLIVPENEAVAAPEDLFEEPNDNGRRRARRRRA
ncbi:MAG: DNA topoisomerase VI subunit B [Planctomycetota bacterium]